MTKHRYLLIKEGDSYRTHQLQKHSILIGASPECDIQLEHPDLPAHFALLSQTPYGTILRNLSEDIALSVNRCYAPELIMAHNDTLLAPGILSAKYLERPPTKEDEQITTNPETYTDIDPLSTLALPKLLYAWMSALQGHAAVIMCNIDRFKNINDNYGMQLGDAVLRAVGCVIRTSTQPPNLVGRIRGDVFVVVMPRGDLAFAAQLAEEIRANIEKLNICQTNATIRAIVAIFSNSDPKEFFSSLDEELYRRGRDANNQVHSCG